MLYHIILGFGRAWKGIYTAYTNEGNGVVWKGIIEMKGIK